MKSLLGSVLDFCGATLHAGATIQASSFLLPALWVHMVSVVVGVAVFDAEAQRPGEAHPMRPPRRSAFGPAGATWARYIRRLEIGSVQLCTRTRRAPEGNSSMPPRWRVSPPGRPASSDNGTFRVT